MDILDKKEGYHLRIRVIPATGQLPIFRRGPHHVAERPSAKPVKGYLNDRILK
jgi:hypothetical protein